MFEHIVVAFDGSEQSQAGFAFAANLAGRVGGRLTLVQVLNPHDEDFPDEPAPELERLIESRERSSAEQLAALAATVPDGVEVEHRVLHGKPAPALLDLLGELRPDLAIAGTGGLGFGRFVLGSVSQRLLERAPCDLLLFHWPEVPTGAVDVIAALDGSEHARRAVGVAEQLAAALPARLVLTHVVDYSLPFPHEPYTAARKLIHDHGVELLREARAGIAAPAESVVEDLREGSPRAQLIAACEERTRAIAVVGSRGSGGFHGLLVGSTARDLVNYSGCPVLVVRASPSDP